MKPLLLSTRQSLEAATRTFEAGLAAPGNSAVEYLRGRGFDHATALDFRLGFVDKVVPGYEHCVGRLAIPNRCAAGHVVGIKFRALTDDVDPKYIKRAGDENRLFNLRALSLAGDVLFTTEGEIDTISLSSLGVPSIAIQGVDSFKDYHWRLLEGYRKVVHVRDNDGPGLELAKRLTATDLPVVVVAPPAGRHDVNDALVNAPDALRALIEEVSK